MNLYYVYALVDPRNNKEFYIGKGKNNRVDDHFKELEKYLNLIEQKIPTSKGRFSNENKLGRMRAIRLEGKETVIKKILENTTEKAAYILEEILIERFGRKCLKNGQLTNLEPGGKWNYPKVLIPKAEKSTIEDIKINFPNLIPILNQYPSVSIESEFLNKMKERISKKEGIEY